MSKFTGLVLCFVAVSVSCVHASEEDKAAIREAIKPIIVECSQQHGVSADEIESAKQAANADAIKPCFIGCVFKKAGLLNSKGEYDVEAGLTKLREFVKNDKDFDKLSEIGKLCVSVNDKPVNDAEAGCERGALLASCFLEHRAEIPI